MREGEEGEPGPDTELEYWRARMSNFNSIAEQLKTRECKLVLAVTAAAKSRSHARWKALDLQVGRGGGERGALLLRLLLLSVTMPARVLGALCRARVA